MPPNFQMLELVPRHCLIYLGTLCPIIFILVMNVMLSHVKEAKEQVLLLLTVIAFNMWDLKTPNSYLSQEEKTKELDSRLPSGV